MKVSPLDPMVLASKQAHGFLHIPCQFWTQTHHFLLNLLSLIIVFGPCHTGTPHNLQSISQQKFNKAKFIKLQKEEEYRPEFDIVWVLGSY
ncbi:hypothetical protein CJ030_MR5G002493 [Morella rubra]|uniref:Uncharacterized protein n=1 Tax=Morella rubra TaxID=262757 RepID=A0A6A1VPA1_9ROSI|nr:hypothetical protein CJ030_MR5G002493 [Morella rubra]